MGKREYLTNLALFRMIFECTEKNNVLSRMTPMYLMVLLEILLENMVAVVFKGI